MANFCVCLGPCLATQCRIAAYVMPKPTTPINKKCKLYLIFYFLYIPVDNMVFIFVCILYFSTFTMTNHFSFYSRNLQCWITVSRYRTNQSAVITRMDAFYCFGYNLAKKCALYCKSLSE
jgi:hypothetical protein